MFTTVYTLRVTYFGFINYCYLVAQNNEGVLIDPAWEIEKIEKTIQEAQVNLKGILLTHHHLDHINLAPTFAQKYNLPVFMSKIEIDFYNFRCPNLVAIENFNLLELGAMKIHLLFTPGHTIGGTSYLIDNNLFCGDTLFIEGCGICSGKGADPHTMFHTLNMFKTHLNPNTLIYPGHSYGHPVGQTFEFVRENNLYLMIKDEEEFVNYRMRSNQKKLFEFK